MIKLNKEFKRDVIFKLYFIKSKVKYLRVVFIVQKPKSPELRNKLSSAIFR